MLFVAFYLPPEKMTHDVESHLLQTWRQKPELRDITIHKITLQSDGGGNYSGFVGIILKGQSARFPIKVHYRLALNINLLK